MKTMVEAIERGGREVFCHFKKGGVTTEITYDALLQGARRYAAFLRACGTHPGEVVLIMLPHSLDLLFAFCGSILVGATPSFIPCRTSKQDPGLYWRSHEKLFERIGGGLLLTYADNLAVIASNLPNMPMRLASTADVPACETDFVSASVEPSDTLLLQHSSGTTGLKKGVMLSHQAVIGQVESYAGSLALTPGDRIASWLPLYHDMGLIACFLLPLVTRTSVVMLDPFEWVVNPGMLCEAIRTHGATLCWMPNFAFQHLCRTVRPSAKIDLRSVRAWINCSEPCRPETFEAFAKHFAAHGVKRENLQVCYAMAETVFAVTQTATTQPPTVLTLDAERLRSAGRAFIQDAASKSVRFLSTGRPVEGLRVRIAGSDDETLPDDVIGEICISGNWLFSGYYRLAEETAKKLRAGWYRSGDLGFMHQGELYVTGRKNDLIIVHGKNYYAHELEFIVNRVPGSHAGRNVAVGWYRPEVGSEDVVVISECEDPSKASRSILAQQIKQALLDEASLPVFDVHVVDPGWLVKTTSGKISRVENLAKYLEEIAQPAAISA